MTSRARVAPGDDPAALRDAVALLREGGLVAFPTETVYGLGADARCGAAVARIYEAKGRPAANPIIVHVLDAAAAREIVDGWDAHAERLAQNFWPGPLTLVLHRGAGIPAIVAAGGPTLAVRAPAHPVARALLRAFGGAIAAPSANRSTAISATSAADVVEELGDRIDLVLDGGPCTVGIESTVLDLTQRTPAILRHGAITAQAIEETIGTAVVEHRRQDGEALRSPGLLERHYAPSKPLVVVDRNEIERQASGRVAVIAVSAVALPAGGLLRRLPDDPSGYGRELYASLRWADRQPVETICVERPPAGEAWRAIHDRLRRAAARG